MKSAVLTIIQFACLGYILLTNQWLADSSLFAAVQAVGILLGIWAVAIMSRSRLNITPVPLKGATLVSSGPYRIIRHPMYLALIFAFYPMLIDNHDLANLIVFGLLLINMLLKLTYEEQLLNKKFPEYAKLTSRTWRLIPGIY